MKDPRFLIRRATPADAPIITAHRRAMFEDMGSGTRDELDAMDAAFEPWVADKLAHGEYLGWLATNGHGAVVAGAGLWLAEWPASPLDQSGKRAYVLNVHTQPEYRRRGFARWLMMTILEYCRQHRLCVVVLHASHQGRPLYESLGFEQTNEMRLRITDRESDE